MDSLRSRARACAETLVIAAIGGSLFGFLGVPAGFVSGSLVAVGAAGLLGRPTYLPSALVRVVMFSLGVVLGSAVSPETLQGLATWPASIAVLAITLVAIFTATSSYLRFVHGWDPLSALFAASPGALSQVVALSIGTKVNLQGVVIVQTIRVVLLAVGLPLALTAIGHVPAQISLPGGIPGHQSVGEIALLLAACAASAYVLQRVRFPGGFMFGAMIASAILHGSGLIEARLPAALAFATMIGIGAVTGSRFGGTSIQLLLRYLRDGIGAFVVAMTVTGGAVAILASLLPLHVADVVLAFSPGAQDAMMILVLALAGDPVYVGAHHLARFLMVSTALPLFMRLLGSEPSEYGATEAAPDD